MPKTPKELPKGALGYKDDFSADDLAGKHIDGVTGLVFETEEAYMGHTSPITGATPADFEHQDALSGGQASRISEGALKRGAERIGK